MVHDKDSSGRLVEPVPHEAWGGTQDSFALLEWIYRELIETRKDTTPEVFLLEDCHPLFSEKKYPEMLRKLATQLKFVNKHVVFVGPYTKLPIEIEKRIKSSTLKKLEEIEDKFFEINSLNDLINILDESKY